MNVAQYCKVLSSLMLGMVLMASASLVQAGEIDHRTKIFTIEDGLSQTGVTCLMVDRQGFLWIGTQDGLNRYDGYQFKIFRWEHSDNHTICDNYIRSIIESKDGFIWIATNNGLSRYDPKTGYFSNFLHNPEDPKTISSSSLYYVYEDYQGTIWVKTLETLEKFNKSDNTFSHYNPYNNLFNFAANEGVFPLFEDQIGRFWVGTKDGLNIFDRNFELFERYVHSPKDPATVSNNVVRAIVEDSRQNLWIGTEKGLNLYNSINKKFERYGDADLSVSALYTTPKSQMVWIGAQKGLYIIDISSKRVSNVLINENQETRNITNISSIVMDNAGIVWIGSPQGLIKLDTKPNKFKLYRNKQEKNATFSNHITSIHIDKQGNHLLATIGSGLLERNYYTDEVAPYRNEQVQKLIGENVHIVTSDKKNRLWIASSNGLFVEEGNTVEPLCKWFPAECERFKNSFFYSIYPDTGQITWFATSQGLFKYSESAKRTLILVNLNLENEKANRYKAFDVSRDRENNIWVGTDKGLFRIEGKDGKITGYSTSVEKPGKISSNYIYSIACGLDGQVWIGTGNGLCLYNKTTDDFTVYTEKNGLVNNTIYSIIIDRSNNLWFGTKRGLARMVTDTEEFNNFDISDGLQGFEFNIGAVHADEYGELFFGGTAGYNSIVPEKLSYSTFKPKVVITSIEIFENGKFYYVTYESNNKLTLPYTTDLVNIDFASLDFTLPQKNLFSYQLSNANDFGNWVNINNKHSATFSKLAPGEYILRIRGTNSDQIWNSNEAMLQITVLRPFWYSYTAITFYFIFAALLVYIIIYFRTSQLRKANKHLMERELIAQAIALQKEELTLKNKNITDSINYAKRIQEALLPTEKNIRKILPQSFVYHKPRDIVSGDFYWIHEVKNKVIVAAVDCTGHGVPGAFMSIIGFEIFRKIANSEANTPGEFLDKIKDDFQKIFRDVEHISLKDGMDVTLCFFDKNTKILEFAAAFNPIYVIHDNKITEVKGDRFSVSLDTDVVKQSFISHTIQLYEGDMVYMFSDGYADQFGGYEGKKYKYRRFRHLLLNIHKLDLEEQKKVLDESIELWRGDYEQVDDILIIGIKA